MLSIFKIRADISRSRSIVGDNPEESAPLLGLQAKPIEEWSSPVFYVGDPRKKDSDFYWLTGNSLVFDERVHEIMADIFERAGQVFPLTVEGSNRQFYLLNVLKVVSAIDKEKSVWEISAEGEQLALVNFHFVRSQLSSESSLFKIPEIFLNPILACHDDAPGSDDFVARYRREGLTGLRFKKLWAEADDA